MAKRRAGTKRKKTRRGASSGPHWGSLLLGFGAGLAIALTVWVYGLPELRRSTAAKPVPEQTAATEPRAPSSERRVKPLQVTGAEYDFYDLLPDQEVTVRTDSGRDNRPVATPTAPIEAPGAYIIQAGSFQNPDDADKMRATVALLGMRAQIQTVEVREQEFHRVIVGPLTELSRLNDYRDRLTREGIDIQVRKRVD
ncbi:MAG: SPOR domain-containing protein [Pseudomonadota bacterium]